MTIGLSVTNALGSAELNSLLASFFIDTNMFIVTKGKVVQVPDSNGIALIKAGKAVPATKTQIESLKVDILV